MDRQEYDRTEFAIKYNNAAVNDPCAVCGERTDPTVGPELFLRDSYAVVCWECGKRYAPELVKMLQAWHVAGHDGPLPDDDPMWLSLLPDSPPEATPPEEPGRN